MRRAAFTMIELIFVIVVMGIIGKFGVEFLMNAYENYFFSTLQNRLQQQSEAAVTQIAARLQYRVKNSVVAGSGSTLSWVGYDIEGWRGAWDDTVNINVPAWSGFIDINMTATPDANFLSTPETNTTRASNIINALSYGTKSIDDAAIIFIGATDPTSTIWDGAVANQLNELAHPINDSGLSGFSPAPSTFDFSGVDVYEFYQLAWSAYTVAIVGTNLTLFYDYQPWQGDTTANARSAVLMENISRFQYQTVGDLIKIQVCVNDQNLAGGYSVCKEKTVF